MRLNTLAPLLLAPFVLAGCALSPRSVESTPPAPQAQSTSPKDPSTAPLAYARFAQRTYVDGPSVTPLELLEDSRCPAEVMCVWEGQVRIKARIHLGSGDEIREMTMGKPIQVADGTLNLVQVLPEKGKRSEEAPEAEYRFGFRFMGGL